MYHRAQVSYRGLSTPDLYINKHCWMNPLWRIMGWLVGICSYYNKLLEKDTKFGL